MSGMLGLSSSSRRPGGPALPNPGDWQCTVCRSSQQAKTTVCRACGANKPFIPGTSTALALVQPNQPAPGDWQCPLCKENCFKNAPFCRKCNTPKPDNAEQAAAIAAYAAMPTLPGAQGIVGYIAPSAVQTAVSSWANQWNSAPANGMFVGEKELPAWLTGADVPDKRNGRGSKSGSDSDSSSNSSKARRKKKQRSELKGKEGSSANGTSGDKGKNPEPEVLSKEERKKRKAEAEAEKRHQMRERREKKLGPKAIIDAESACSVIDAEAETLLEID